MTGSWAHQDRAWAFLREHKVALLHLPMGSGKTRIAAEELAKPGHTPALILTRSKVIEDGVWDRELGRVEIEALPLTGPIVYRANSLAQWMAAGMCGAVVVNYEGCWREPLATAILRIPWRTVIADEQHHLKAAGSKVSRFAARLNTVPYRIGLSGTPMAHSPLDVYGQFRFLEPSIYGTNFNRFRNRYAVMGGFQGHQVIGYQNQAEFMRRYWLVTFQVKDDELAYSLPEDFDIPLVHDLPSSVKQLYHELETEFWAEVGSSSVTIANAAVKVLRLQQLAAGHIRDDEGTVKTIHQARADALASWMEDVDPSEPVVVFCRFRHDLDAIANVCASLSRSYAEVSGRTDDLTIWKEGKRTVLGVQIQAGGEGINLTRAALGVYYSVGHSLSDYLQSRARLVRPGQTRPVRFYHLTARGTVDNRVYASLKAHENVIQNLLNIKEGALTR